MAYLLFVDESGHDRRESPYEVLAGVAIEDARTWDLIRAIHDAETEAFGCRISLRERELKGKELLKRKTFKLARQGPPIHPNERTEFARGCLTTSTPTRRQLTALGQAKLAFVEAVFDLCERHGAHTFASIVDPAVPRPAHGVLRRDYASLFERYFDFLGEQAGQPQGLVIFDELERSRSHVLIEQMDEYFERSEAGSGRSARILPEPLFVHSDLSTLVQVADLVAYLVSWAVRVDGLDQPARGELRALGERVYRLRHHERNSPDDHGSFVMIDAL
ncbi:MAG: DUF3800 domain-containing protein [Myxococcales bacterium]|nr:DUF3800 domain-containing protein [Myxococcales bacterium]